MTSLGQLLKKARLDKCLSQKQLASELGIQPQTISYYENDKKKPALKVLRKYCEYFGLEPSTLSKLKYEEKVENPNK